MNKFLKGLGITLGLSGVLVLGACSESTESITNETNEVVFEFGDKTYSELNLLSDINALAGDTVILQAMLGEVLTETYEVTKEEIKELKEQYFEQAGGEELFYDSLKEAGLTKEQIDRQLRIEIAHNKALVDLNEVTEEKIKEVYKDIKFAVDGLHYITMDKELAEKVKNQLEEDKELDEINSELDPQEPVQKALFIKGHVEEEFLPLFDELKEGEVLLFEKDGLQHVVKKVEDIERTYEELKDGIEEELMYEGVESALDVLKFVLDKEEGKFEFSGEYKELIERVFSEEE